MTVEYCGMCQTCSFTNSRGHTDSAKPSLIHLGLRLYISHKLPSDLSWMEPLRRKARLCRRFSQYLANLVPKSGHRRGMHRGAAYVWQSKLRVRSGGDFPVVCTCLIYTSSAVRLVLLGLLSMWLDWPPDSRCLPVPLRLACYLQPPSSVIGRIT